MIPKECKRLAEVDFPIAAVSKHAVREKSIRHGHPNTLHLWWARRPLASSRAVLMALLLPDPCDEKCPEEFKNKARVLLPPVVGQVGLKDEELRAKLLKFIADFANWENASNPAYLDLGRALVKVAHGKEPPLVLDSFAGGGSIPLEALRLGCNAFASDLNPVACLILKMMLEDIPRHGPEVSQELREVGDKVKRQAEQELDALYPQEPGGAVPIAYLWARTLYCEAPDCGAEIPLMRSFWLCKKTKRMRALRPLVHRPEGARPHVKFEIFEPKTDSEVNSGTVNRAKAACLCCGVVLSAERVRFQLAAERGGADVVFDEKGNRIGGARMMAVVTLKPGEKSRYYRLPTKTDYATVHRAQQRLDEILHEWEQEGRQGLCPVPNEPTPAGGGSGAGRALAVHRYGLLQWGDLFTARQKVAIEMLLSSVRDNGLSRSRLVLELLALSFGKLARHCNVLSKWHTGSETVAGAFGMHTLPMSWDFPEMYPMAAYAGGLGNSIEDVAHCVPKISSGTPTLELGQVEIANSVKHPLPDETTDFWFIDPPYYDAVPYADLSDFFLVWLKRIIPEHPMLRDPFELDNILSPKTAEIVQDETRQVDGRPKDREWFEETMAKAFTEGRRVLKEDGIGSVVFAHKTTEGWEALLSGMIRGGWTITSSWPITTERGARLRARDSAALATSVHLTCRPRSGSAPVGDWADVLQELPIRVVDWMERLQREGVRGADLVFACIGPALEIFSRYASIETADGRSVYLPEYLEKVWEVVGRTALEQILGTAEARAQIGLNGALEEDARLTAIFLWTLQSTDGEFVSDSENESLDNDNMEQEETSQKKAKGYKLIFDVVRRFSQPLGIHLPEWEGRIIKTTKGVVRLLPVSEREIQLFGESGVGMLADEIETSPMAARQLTLFPEQTKTIRGRGRRRGPTVASNETLEASAQATTLDLVHSAMLLQASGRSQALRNLLEAEQERGPDFLRLANALSALYPRGSEEKRLLDAMLLAVPK